MSQDLDFDKEESYFFTRTGERLKENDNWDWGYTLWYKNGELIRKRTFFSEQVAKQLESVSEEDS